ncbi:hypothetical protein ACVWZA_003425 [Sphingomonas sp. UYAg733]
MARPAHNDAIMLASPLGGAPLPCVPRWRPRPTIDSKIHKGPVTNKLNLLLSIPASALSPVTNGGAPCAF